MLLLATFQWLINQVTVEVNGWEAYIDDVIIYSNKVNLHDNQSDKKWIWLADIKYLMELHASVHSEYNYNDDYKPQTIWNSVMHVLEILHFMLFHAY